MNYLLINNKIMKCKKMPLHVYSDHPNWYDSKMYLNSKDYLDWLSSLQPCEISESELDKVKVNLRLPLDLTNPIEVTDIISDNNGVITFKEKEHKLEDYKKSLHYHCDDQCFYNCSQAGTIEPQCLQPKQVDGEIEAVEKYSKEWIIGFVVWYSGMNNKSVSQAFQRYIDEVILNTK